MGKLKLEDLHPILHNVYEIGCEVESAMTSSIKPGNGIERTVLNVTHDIEENRNKVESRKIVRHPSGRDVEIVTYVKEPRWRVHFDFIDGNDKFHSGLSVAFDDSDGETQVLEQSRRIAGELQAIYRLPYTPQVYRDSRPIEV